MRNNRTNNGSCTKHAEYSPAHGIYCRETGPSTAHCVNTDVPPRTSYCAATGLHISSPQTHGQEPRVHVVRRVPTNHRICCPASKRTQHKPPPEWHRKLYNTCSNPLALKFTSCRQQKSKHHLHASDMTRIGPRSNLHCCKDTSRSRKWAEAAESRVLRKAPLCSAAGALEAKPETSITWAPLLQRRDICKLTCQRQ